MSQTPFSRRTFIASTIAGSLAGSAVLRAVAAEPRNGIPYRKLGRTGAEVSALGIGGFHLGEKPTEEEAIRIVRTALDQGVNFLDNCWDYNEGKSEVRMGKALRDGYREKAFLMTKIDGRNRNTAALQINESLQRLGVDHVDLLQMHEVIRHDDADRVFAKGGGMEAMIEAQKAGKARFLGFTGHKHPDIHLHMLEVAAQHGFHFDTVQMPLNVMDAHYESFEKKVLPRLVEAGIGVLGMKPLGSGEILKSKTVTAPECLRYAMSLPVSVTITGCDSMAILEQALGVARGFQPLDAQGMEALLSKSSPSATKGQHELYKTSQRFDATSSHPQWLG